VCLSAMMMWWHSHEHLMKHLDCKDISVSVRLCVCTCLYVCLSVCLYVCLSVFCASLCLSVCLSVCLCPCIHLAYLIPRRRQISRALSRSIGSFFKAALVMFFVNNQPPTTATWIFGSNYSMGSSCLGLSYLWLCKRCHQNPRQEVRLSAKKVQKGKLTNLDVAL
jgi:hypothetical protein